MSGLDVYFLRHECLCFYSQVCSVLSFQAVDHRCQPKCNWTRGAASGLSLSLITNYNRGQLRLPKLYSKQCWFYCPRHLLIHASIKWKAYWVSSFPRMLTETNNECSSTKLSERSTGSTSLKLQIFIPTTALLIAVIFHNTT